MLSVIMLSVIMLIVSMLIVSMLIVSRLSVSMLGVSMLSVSMLSLWFLNSKVNWPLKLAADCKKNFVSIFGQKIEQILTLPQRYWPIKIIILD